MVMSAIYAYAFPESMKATYEEHHLLSYKEPFMHKLNSICTFFQDFLADLVCITKHTTPCRVPNNQRTRMGLATLLAYIDRVCILL